MGLYYASTADGSNLPLGEISARMTSYGWDGGWRIQDDAAGTIWSAGQTPPHLFTYVPFVFIVDTLTMEIAAADGGSPLEPVELDVLDALQQL